MGLTPFPATLCLHLANLARAQVFIETGTYLGETARWAAKFFSDVRTVELGAERYADTSAALRDLSNVVCYQGDSRAVLAKLREELAGTPSVMWLDGHWSGDDTAGKNDECPLAAAPAQARPVADPAGDRPRAAARHVRSGHSRRHLRRSQLPARRADRLPARGAVSVGAVPGGIERTASGVYDFRRCRSRRWG